MDVGLDEYLAAADRGEDLDTTERKELDAAAARLRRRGEDQQIVEQLVACEFRGAYFETYRTELIAYAMPVLMSWIRRSVIFALCADRRRPVSVSDLVRRQLADNRDDRLELAYETLAEALVQFIRYGLIEGRWSVEGGANLKTYLIGAAINAFPNVFRRWDREQGHRLTYGIDVTEIPHRSAVFQPDADPAELGVARRMVRDELARLDPDLREFAARVAFNDETQLQIARALGMDERAIEGRLYRLRAKRKTRTRNRKGGRHDD